ncbi:MAG: phosphopentomutase [Erysipelotrichaceae bacterium]|nr:phosphopentomutase [Erysipelotrichaceae bacterium]
MKYRRIFLIVIDSLGVGNSFDAMDYNDEGADTLGHIAKAKQPLQIPTLVSLGIANLHPLSSIQPCQTPLGYYTKLIEKGVGKDTMSGHYELMGLHVKHAFPTFTKTGFPKSFIQKLEHRTGHRCIGNKAASGTEIINELGEEQIKTNALIVYTSADSVLQICGNEETMGLEELYRCCEIARELTMKDEWKVGRVIARPYTGLKAGEFIRTANRHDYALKPFDQTVLNHLRAKDLEVIGIGKIHDIFDGEGIHITYRSQSSVHGMDQTIACMDQDFKGLCFVNLVDFDAQWGHRRNPIGYGEELERFDQKLSTVLRKLKQDDLLMITADHGNDPTYAGNDHTREMVPLLAYSPSMKGFGLLPIQNSFASVGKTIADNFHVKQPVIGRSLLHLLK